jgi:predicted nucleotide-binding protein (sugar kinase/HSP70/actin superfamily)
MDPREAYKKKYVAKVLENAKLIAMKRTKSLMATTADLVYALVEEMGEAYLCNNEMAATINGLGKEIDELKARLDSLDGSKEGLN